MSEFKPIATIEDLALQDQNEIVEGYWAGRDGEPEPGSDKSRSYWHGWRNGMVDSGRMPKDAAQCELAREVVASWVRH